MIEVADIIGGVKLVIARETKTYTDAEWKYAINLAQSMLFSEFVFGSKSQRAGALESPEARASHMVQSATYPFYDRELSLNGVDGYFEVPERCARLDRVVGKFGDGKVTAADILPVHAVTNREKGSLIETNSSHPFCWLENGQLRVLPTPAKVDLYFVKKFERVNITADSTGEILTSTPATLAWPEHCLPRLVATVAGLLLGNIRDLQGLGINATIVAQS
jgi:hypothetical protein